MSKTQSQTETQDTTTQVASSGLMQRKCACGTHTNGAAKCEECESNEATVQRASCRNAARNENTRPDSSSSRATANNTGMSASLLSGLERLSGFDLSSIRVHHDSTEPAQVDALAYTQGTNIYVGPGQERHLPHEGWHVVQQLQGRVAPTMQMKGMLLNDNDALEREADIMGAKASALGEQDGAVSFQTRLASATGGESDDEPFVASVVPTAQRLADPPIKQRVSNSISRVIQRAASFVAGTISATTNMASHLIAGNRDAGFTPPRLNGNTILSTAAAQAAIQAPTLMGRSNTDGTVAKSVATVGTNQGSFTMQVPSAGPWSTTTAKTNVAALFASLRLTAQAPCSTAGNSTFSVNGKPTDADFAANVRTHENLHAADHEAGFNAVIGRWDTRLEAAKTARTWFNGATDADADAALFTAMGGTPNQIAAAQFADWINRNNITHRGRTLATGGIATPSNSAADATCSTSSLDLS